jgi:Restriction endonuclease EcoRV
MDLKDKNKSDLKSGNGIFSQLGEEWFDEYWINHGAATMLKEGKTSKITTLKDFLEFKGRTDLWDKIVLKTSNKKTK